MEKALASAALRRHATRLVDGAGSSPILVYNLDENTLLTFNGLPWVLYVSVLANIELIRAEDRVSARIRQAVHSLSVQRLNREPEWQQTPS